MYLYHITSLSAAKRIIFGKKFFVNNVDPVAEDSWANFGIIGKKFELSEQIITSREVILIFVWEGEVRGRVRTSELEIDCLYDEAPLRALVKVGSTKYLKLVAMEVGSTKERFGRKFPDLDVEDIEWVTANFHRELPKGFRIARLIWWAVQGRWIAQSYTKYQIDRELSKESNISVSMRVQVRYELSDAGVVKMHVNLN